MDRLELNFPLNESCLLDLEWPLYVPAYHCVNGHHSCSIC